ncbi:unnamed protein product [Urochloa decumbens]|uniref:F-box domain-containing protein n=1 Tax=Urochloa decumbens TaxID=240449 RepID=A0ABC9FK74_9POAL
MELLEELVEEIFLRIPPEEPAYLVRAALVCKSWCRILSDRGFHRRYRMCHRTPPLLGYLHNLWNHPSVRPRVHYVPRFVHTSTVSPFTSPPPFGEPRQWRALDCRHGRVLARILVKPYHLVVWDPVTGGRQELSVSDSPTSYWYSGAVLCAAHSDGCDHLDCHDDPFTVVYMVADAGSVVRAKVYSSETGAWGEPTSVTVHGGNAFDDRPSLLIGGALHLGLISNSVVKYDLHGHSLSVIDRPGGDELVMVKAEDGGLGFVAVSDGCIYLWTRQANGGWVRHKAAELKRMLLGGLRSKPHDVVGFVESTGTIFINRTAGVYALDLSKSRQARMVGEEKGPYTDILPYMSFYTPDIAKGRLSPP